MLRDGDQGADPSVTLIVRGDSYLRDFRPPALEDLSAVEIATTQRAIAVAESTGDVPPWASPHIHRLPALPPLMFLQVLLVPCSKGVDPRSGRAGLSVRSGRGSTCAAQAARQWPPQGCQPGRGVTK